MAAPARRRAHTNGNRRTTAARTASKASKPAAAKAGGSSSAAKGPDAIQMLKDDHAKVKDLFERFESARGESQKERLSSTICQELKVHTQLEEEIFYPAVRAAIDDPDLMNEAEIEHASAKDLIQQIEGGSPSDEKFDALVTVLGEYVKHHIQEEESEMFKKVRGAELDLASLGREMKVRKGQIAGGATPKRGKGDDTSPRRGIIGTLFAG